MRTLSVIYATAIVAQAFLGMFIRPNLGRSQELQTPQPQILMDTSMAKVMADIWVSKDTTRLMCAFGTRKIERNGALTLDVDSLTVGARCDGVHTFGVIGFILDKVDEDQQAVLDGMRRVIRNRPYLSFACEVWAVERQEMYGNWLTVPRSWCAVRNEPMSTENPGS